MGGRLWERKEEIEEGGERRRGVRERCIWRKEREGRKKTLRDRGEERERGSDKGEMERVKKRREI